jgi:hypothetical protein
MKALITSVIIEDETLALSWDLGQGLRVIWKL